VNAAPTPRTRRRATLLGVLALVVVSILFARYVFSSHETVADPIAFDRRQWIAAPDDADTRWRMLPDLLAKHALIGMTRRDVEELLGKADRESWSSVQPHPGYLLKWITIDGLLGDQRRTPLLIVYSEGDIVLGYWSRVAEAGRAADVGAR
jgi:hypothetical protein